MKLNELLNEVNKDIKDSEKFLQKECVVIKVLFKANESTYIIWDNKLKRILLSKMQLEKPLLEWDVKTRLWAYEYFPEFLKCCISERDNHIDTNFFDKIRQQIKNIIEE